MNDDYRLLTYEDYLILTRLPGEDAEIDYRRMLEIEHTKQRHEALLYRLRNAPLRPEDMAAIEEEHRALLNALRGFGVLGRDV